MADWRAWYQGWGDPNSFAHPDSPSGGAGPGFARPPVQTGYTWSPVPHPDSPAGRLYQWQQSLQKLDFTERPRAVYRAITHALPYVPDALYEATGQELHAMLEGIIPGLLMFAAILGLTTGVGAAAGAAVGALAFGVGAAPGAAAGATLGFEAGLALLEYLGLAFLLGYIGKSLMDAGEVATDAVVKAWYSVDQPATEAAVVEHSAQRLAYAVGLVFRGILQGVIAYLMAKGTSAAASRVPELVGKLKNSKLGAGFAEWIEKNWRGLVENPKLKEPTKAGTPGGAVAEGEGGTGIVESAAKIEAKAAGDARRTQSYKDIEAHRQKYQSAEDAARQAGENRKAGGYKAKVTEAVGEKAATEYMEKNNPDFVMDKGFKPGQGFDQVYTKYDAAGNPTEMMIVEAKGPGAQLSTNAAKGPQMSQEWVENTVSDMVKSDDPATKALGQRLQTALDDGEPPVTGKVLEAVQGGGAKEVPLPDNPVYNGGRYN
jgi:hypothetical protein